MMIDDLFTFPIVMVDGENEERKEKEHERFGEMPGQEPTEVEYDIVYGEASYPYYDFVGFEDRWLPTQRSLGRALKKKFDACTVRFANVGQFLVPWSKEKFREEIKNFISEREKVSQIEDDDVTVIKVSTVMLTNLLRGNEKKE